MTGVEVAAIGLIVGTGLSVAGQVNEANEKAGSARQQARLKDLQAEEIMARSQIEQESARIDFEDLREFQISRRAATGAESTSTSSLLGRDLMRLNRNLQLIQRRAEFEARTLRQEAAALRGTGRAIQTAGALGAGGTILGSTTRAGGLLDPRGQTEDIGDPFDAFNS